MVYNKPYPLQWAWSPTLVILRCQSSSFMLPLPEEHRLKSRFDFIDNTCHLGISPTCAVQPTMHSLFSLPCPVLCSWITALVHHETYQRQISRFFSIPYHKARRFAATLVAAAYDRWTVRIHVPKFARAANVIVCTQDSLSITNIDQKVSVL